MSKILKRVNFAADDKVSVQISKSEPVSDAPITALPPRSSSFAETGPPLPDPQAEAKNLLAETQAQVETMLEQAQTQLKTWQEEAQKAGFEAGYTQARQQVEAELSEALITIQALSQAAVEAKNQFLRNSQLEIGRLAVAIAEKIIGKELEMNPNTITDIVAHAIETANIQGACYVRVNPQDYEILSPHWEVVPSLRQPDQAWTLLADKRISRGGCLIEIGGGVVDAQLETQLNQAAVAFQGIG